MGKRSAIVEWINLLAISTAVLSSTSCVLEASEDSDGPYQVTIKAEIANSPAWIGEYYFNASNTNNAQRNTDLLLVPLDAGDKLTVGTCELPYAYFSGDTWIRLKSPEGVELASNDDSCGGLGSKITHDVTTPGFYQVRPGCYGDTSCLGRLIVQVEPGLLRGSFIYSASDTDSARMNTTNQSVYLSRNQKLTVATCGLPDSSFSGHTYLTLTPHNSSTVIGSSNSECGGDGAVMEYVATSDGPYLIRAGCYQDVSCSGVVVWAVEPRSGGN